MRARKVPRVVAAVYDCGGNSGFTYPWSLTAAKAGIIDPGYNPAKFA